MGENKSIDNDLDLYCPIALRKGVRSYTKHLIYDFITYKGLSLIFCICVTSFDKLHILNDGYKALKTLELKKATIEEFQSLKIIVREKFLSFHQNKVGWMQMDFSN